MKILLYIALVFICFSFNTKQETNQLNESVSSIYNGYNLTVKLADERTGEDVSADTLDGYIAQDVSNGQYIYANRGENVIRNLPAGTYIIRAYEGYFDGAHSEVITIEEGGKRNYEVTLKYWSE